ncbi:MAG: hypothetical protein BA870_03885 [Desulfuromonadales bacterium C00003094]|nr:MAG: hypothetical protein BA870_03885 [Desulfuromonadales bacterium C00003094]OEU72904.1 MAG: hypothetical protein BA869_08730 [Desulfuromonadales bacterium C00003107]
MQGMLFFTVVLLLSASSCSPVLKPTPTHRLQIDKRLQLAMALPSPRWQFSTEAPTFVAKKMSDHLRQEVVAAVPNINDEQLLLLARKRLAVNEAYVFNEHSGACLMIDFSSRRQGKTDPTLAELKGSAYGALLALANEEGVADLESRISTSAIAGSSRACRVEASYLLDGQARSFIGIIGFKTPYRFYLYYNEAGRDPRDRIEMEQVLKSLQLLLASQLG